MLGGLLFATFWMGMLSVFDREIPLTFAKMPNPLAVPCRLAVPNPWVVASGLLQDS